MSGSGDPWQVVFADWRERCLSPLAGVEERHELREEAMEFFSSLVHSTKIRDGNKNLTTKSSHPQALARLIQVLGDGIFQSKEKKTTYTNQLSALYCLGGALDGTRDTDDGLPSELQGLLGNFFLQYCGPLVEEEGDFEDKDEMMRDAAMKCLVSLLRIRSPSETQRLQLARDGVRRRCAAPEEEGYVDHGFSQNQTMDTIGGGLSTLPRSRRTLCFDVLSAALEGTNTPSSNESAGTSSTVKSEIASFVVFVASCLHGESDPRCLQQLLHLFASVQATLFSFFSADPANANSNSNTVGFPSLALLDATAPYYPIKFTPPPNDPHGITRQGLQQSLMHIFCHHDMVAHSIGVVLEELTEGNEGKVETLRDLETLLFPSGLSNCSSLEIPTLRELSTTLISVHEDASSATLSSRNAALPKSIADAVRRLACKIAQGLETSASVDMNKAPWSAFVEESLKMQVSLLSTSPQSMRGRSAAAYFASLANAGPLTLDACLQRALPSLLNPVQQLDDEEKLTAAAYEIVAFLSSFRVVSQNTTVLPSQQLQEICPTLLKQMVSLLLEEQASHVGTRIAAIRVIEAILLVSPVSMLDERDLQSAKRYVHYLMETVSSSSCDEETLEVASKMLGSVIGEAMNESTAQPSNSVFKAPSEVRDYLRDNVLHQMLESSCKPSDYLDATPNGVRWDIAVLSRACESNSTITTTVLGKMYTKLRDTLPLGDSASQREAIHVARTFSWILGKAGMFLDQVASEALEQDIELIGIVKDICSFHGERSLENAKKSGMSRLELPSTSQGKEQTTMMVSPSIV